MMRMQPATSIPVSECLWGDPDDFSKFIDGIVFQWYHLNTILSINCLLSKIIYIILQLHFNCQQPLCVCHSRCNQLLHLQVAGQALTQQQHKCLGSQPERKAWPFGWAFFFLLCVLFTLPLDSACPSPCGLWSSGP